MSKIKIIIGCLIILVLVLFGFNQFQQYQNVQEQKRIEAEIKKQNEEIQKNYEIQVNNHKSTQMRRGTL